MIIFVVYWTAWQLVWFNVQLCGCMNDCWLFVPWLVNYLTINLTDLIKLTELTGWIFWFLELFDLFFTDWLVWSQLFYRLIWPYFTMIDCWLFNWIILNCFTDMIIGGYCIAYIIGSLTQDIRIETWSSHLVEPIDSL